MSSDIEKIKERLNIVDVIGSYINLKKAGSNFKAPCPFHNDKDPSFVVSPDRGNYYCFGCGAKGDIFSFVQEFEGLDFKGALKILANRAGVTLKNEGKENKDEKEKLFLILEVATLFFQKKLGENEDVRNYLKKRGVVADTAKKWRLGYAPNDWRELFDYLSSRGYKESDLLRVGLIKKTDDNRTYDTFRGRVIFPIFDTSGRVIAFSGRIFVENDKAPKYLNSPDTVLFNKSETLYGLNVAKSEIRKKDFSIIVEGQMDLILLHQSGYENAVATSGTALTNGHLSRLNKLSSKVAFTFDSDGAGLRAVERGASIALALGFDTKVVSLPSDSDPADLVISNPEKFKESLENREDVISFILKDAKNSENFISEISNRIFPLINLMPSKMEQTQYVKMIAKETGISEDAVMADLEKQSYVPENRITEESQPIIQKSNMTIEELFVGIILLKESRKDEILSSIKEVVPIEYVDNLLNELSGQKEEILFKVEKLFESYDLEDSHIQEIVLRLQDNYLLRKIEEVSKVIKNLESEKLEGDLNENLKYYQDLIKKREELLKI